MSNVSNIPNNANYRVSQKNAPMFQNFPQPGSIFSVTPYIKTV